MARPKFRPSASSWTVLLTLLVVPAVALGAWSLVARQPDLTAAARPVVPVVVTPERFERIPETTRTMTFEQADGFELRVEVAGLVTRAPRPGAAPKPGGTVLEIDGRPVVAFDGPAPLWRVLGEGDKGDDVAALQRWLSGTGYDAGKADGTFGRTLRVAVVAFNEATGRGKVATFDPASVVWTGEEPPAIDSVDVVAGDRVSPGTVVATGPARVVGATLAAPEGSQPTAVAGPEMELVLGELVVPLGTDADRVTDDDDLASLASAARGQESVNVRLRPTRAEPVLAVPVTALVQSRDGTRCLFPDAVGAPVTVAVVGGGLASVHLDVTTPVTTVLANPAAIRVGETCAS